MTAVKSVFYLTLIYFIRPVWLEKICASNGSEVVFSQPGEVSITALLDLTKGPGCNQANAEASQTLHGILQAVKVLNEARYLNRHKLGIRVYDTCGQDHQALNSVLSTAVEFNFAGDSNCKNATHLGFLTNKKLPLTVSQLIPALSFGVMDMATQQESEVPLSAITELLSKLNWTTVAVLSQSKQVVSDFSRKAREKNICVLAQGVISPEPYRLKENIQRSLRRMSKSEAKINVVFGTTKIFTEVALFFDYHEISTKLLFVHDSVSKLTNTEELLNATNNTIVTVQPTDSVSEEIKGAKAVLLMAKNFKKLCTNSTSGCKVFENLKFSNEELELLKNATDSSGLVHGFFVNAILPGESYSFATIKGNDQLIWNNHTNLENLQCDDCSCRNIEPNTNWSLKTDLPMLIMMGFTLLGFVIFCSSALVLRRHFRKISKNSFLIFVILFVLLLYLSVVLFFLKPNELGCYYRFLLLSATFSLTVSFLFARTVAKFIQPGPENNIVCQCVLFSFSMALQVVILIYEIQGNSFSFVQKIVTDFGAKFECWFPSLLLLKIFVYPLVLQFVLFVVSCVEIRNFENLSRSQVCLYNAALMLTPVNCTCVACFILLGKQWQDLAVVVAANVDALILFVFFLLFPLIEEVKRISGKSEEQTVTFDNVVGSEENRQHIYAVPSHEYEACPPELTMSTHL